MTLETASSISENASEALLLLALAGAALACLRWPRVPRKDFLLSLILILVSTALAQLPVYLGGMTGWGVDLVLLAGMARWGQVLGAVLYMRASLKDYCGPWGWVLVTLFVAFWTWII